MPSSLPPPHAPVTSALGLGLDAFSAIRTALESRTADARAAFELTLSSPHRDWGFMVLAGVEPLVDALEKLRVRSEEIEWLASVGAIDAASRRRLAEMRFACDVDAAPEGSVVFPGEAVLSIEGPYWQAQLVGGFVVAAIADATLVATRFARMALASRGARTVEHGSTFAHRIGGVPALARAAYVGGAAATTNAVAARRWEIPAHVGPAALFGAGDLSMLDPGARLARFDLVAFEKEGAWTPRLRVADDALSSSDPGRKLLVRYVDADDRPVADVAHSTQERMLRAQSGRFVDRNTGLACRLSAAKSAPLRTSILRAGKRVGPAEPTRALRDRAARAVQSLHDAYRRPDSPARYPVGITQAIVQLKAELLAKAGE